MSIIWVIIALGGYLGSGFTTAWRCLPSMWDEAHASTKSDNDAQETARKWAALTVVLWPYVLTRLAIMALADRGDPAAHARYIADLERQAGIGQ
jgi:hypothetical protein